MEKEISETDLTVDFFKNLSDCWDRLPSSPLWNHQSENTQTVHAFGIHFPEKNVFIFNSREIWLKASFVRFSAKREGEVKVIHLRHQYSTC